MFGSLNFFHGELRPLVIEREDAADVLADDAEDDENHATREEDGDRERGPSDRHGVEERAYEEGRPEGEAQRRGEDAEIDDPAQRQRREIEEDMRREVDRLEQR